MLAWDISISGNFWRIAVETGWLLSASALPETAARVVGITILVTISATAAARPNAPASPAINPRPGRRIVSSGGDGIRSGLNDAQNFSARSCGLDFSLIGRTSASWKPTLVRGREGCVAACDEGLDSRSRRWAASMTSSSRRRDSSWRRGSFTRGWASLTCLSVLSWTKALITDLLSTDSWREGERLSYLLRYGLNPPLETPTRWVPTNGLAQWSLSVGGSRNWQAEAIFAPF